MVRPRLCNVYIVLTLTISVVACGPGAKQPSEFTFNPPGQLQPNSGNGYTDGFIFVPGMRFPIEQPKAFANSQVWDHGGMEGPGGGQCDQVNYSYPWKDDFCEKREWKVAFCPDGKGHQGQDIRPNTCEKGKYLAVAAEPGTITQIGSYSVWLSADSGRTFRYLHLDMTKLKVSLGQQVMRGQPIGFISDFFGSSETTIHLHFDVKETLTEGTTTVTSFVPPYSSLVDAYQRLLAGNP